MKRIAFLAAGSALLAIPAVIGLSAATVSSAKAPVPSAQVTEVHGIGHGADDLAAPSPAAQATRHASPSPGATRHAEPGGDRGGDRTGTSNRGPGSNSGSGGNSGSGDDDGSGGDDGPNHH